MTDAEIPPSRGSWLGLIPRHSLVWFCGEMNPPYRATASVVMNDGYRLAIHAGRCDEKCHGVAFARIGLNVAASLKRSGSNAINRELKIRMGVRFQIRHLKADYTSGSFVSGLPCHGLDSLELHPPGYVRCATIFRIRQDDFSRTFRSSTLSGLSRLWRIDMHHPSFDRRLEGNIVLIAHRYGQAVHTGCR